MKIRHGRFYTKLVVIFVAILTLTGYAVFETEALFSGPQISINLPKTGATAVKEPLLKMGGVIKNASFVYLNDRQIFADENGFFSEKLLLAKGYNIITLRAKDRFNREKKKTIEVVRLPI